MSYVRKPLRTTNRRQKHSAPVLVRRLGLNDPATLAALLEKWSSFNLSKIKRAAGSLCLYDNQESPNIYSTTGFDFL